MRLGICAFPLSKGRETGRGLERVIEEFVTCLREERADFSFYDRGIIRNEIAAVYMSLKYLWELRRTKDDCYFAVYAVSGIFPALLKKTPLVTLITDMIPYNVTSYDNKLKYAIKRWCIRFSCRRSDLLIVGSSTIKNEIISRFGISPEKIVSVPWGLNHKTYYPLEASGKTKHKIAFLGEAKKAKGIDSVIKAFKLILEKIPDATLSIASNGSEIEEMRALAAKTLPTGSYKFEGFIPEDGMNAYYNSVDLFIFPSRYGFGLSALEAMATGTPTLVGNTLDARDFFTDTDILVNPDDEAEIAAKASRILQDPSLKHEKSTKAVELAGQFSWERMSRGYLQACTTAAHQADRGR